MGSALLSSGPSSSSSSSSVSGAAVICDDSFEDACSICLEPFSSLDPPSVTKCKHEYHLQCILEWSQRSDECPICSQHLILKDPASQELLAGVKADKDLRLKNNIHPVGRDDEVMSNQVSQDAPHVDDTDFEQRVLRHFATVVSRARNISRNRKQITPPVGPSQVVPSVPATNASNGTPLDRSSHELHLNSSPSPPDNPRTSSSSELVTFSESLKSKISIASAKYKESISKNTRGLKEKLVARNDSVKELSREVQREMSAGFSRMIDRLDFIPKRGGVSSPSNLPHGAKGIDNNV